MLRGVLGSHFFSCKTYLLQLYTTKLDTSKLTEEQIRHAEQIASEIEMGSKGKNNRKKGEVSCCGMPFCALSERFFPLSPALTLPLSADNEGRLPN